MKLEKKGKTNNSTIILACNREGIKH